MKKGNKAFTLVECLVVIGIVLTLAALSLGPGLSTFRGHATSAGCVSNMKQIGAAFYMYAGENNGDFPAVAGEAAASSKDDQDGKGKQWDAQLSSYLSIPVNTSKSPLRNSAYCCPASYADPSYAGKPVVLLSYTYNANIGKSETSSGVKVGAGENYPTVVLLADLQLPSSTENRSYVPQTGQGKNNTIVFRPPASNYKFLADRHRGRMNILFLDGHVDSRTRNAENDPNSPPKNVRWKPNGPLTSD